MIIFISYRCGISIEKAAVAKKKKILILGIAINIAILIGFKYSFFKSALNSFLENLNLNNWLAIEVTLPVGISFYMFQTLGYIIDVYKGETKPSKDFIEYTLFITFFPQLIAGPIERSSNMLKQIKGLDSVELFNYKRVESGFIIMLWGYFLKTVIADRAALIADSVFKDFYLYGSVELIVGVLCFSIQIYCDFAGYSSIAIGAARILGIDLMENFNAPYFSRSIKEFWSRWHISLSTWFRDYVYIPLGGNRKGKLIKYRNLMVVFILSGIWHGSDWSFALWGGLHGIYLVCEDACLKRNNKDDNKYFSSKLFEVMITNLLVAFTWIFFRSDNISNAIVYIYRIFTCFDLWVLFDGGIYSIGVKPIEFDLLLIAVMLLIGVEAICYKKRKKIDWLLQTQSTWFRLTVVIVLICSCIFFNCSNNGLSKNQFIYFQF